MIILEFFLMLYCYVLKVVCRGKNPSYPVTKQTPLHCYKKRRGLYIYIIFYNNITIIGKNVTQPSKYAGFALLHLLLQNHFKT
jgi:hypothetical protein